MITLPESNLDLSIANKIFLNYSLSIESTTAIPNKQPIQIERLDNTSKPLYDYIFLKPILVNNEDINPSPMPFRVKKSDLLYINAELARIKADEILKLDDTTTELDIDFDQGGDTESSSTTESAPKVLSCIETITLDKSFFVEEWLSSKIDFCCETNTSCSSFQTTRSSQSMHKDKSTN